MPHAEGTVLLILILVAFIVAVLWILMPFAVFGIKGLLRQAIQEQMMTRQLLEQLLSERKEPWIGPTIDVHR